MKQGSFLITSKKSVFHVQETAVGGFMIVLQYSITSLMLPAVLGDIGSGDTIYLLLDHLK
ncbi:MAG: hypothetical protein CVU51_01245 [Deltaproteobacteria bacterium HGW-Deltaproteobacteria-1]|nr:MAG: hypothetical protein CVU51_01245 [Deltaproteobacteria bacterium HGW-Deltaproteobacteria-1]